MNAIQLTKELVAINSVNPFSTVEADGEVLGVGCEGPINEFLEGLLRSAGFDVERQIVQPARTVALNGSPVSLPARWNITAERRPAGTANRTSLLFFGHTDTVDVKSGWQTDPFVATEKTVDGRKRLYGLGANDMKAGLAAIVAVVANTAAAAIPLKIAIVCDEEFWSFGADVLAKSEFLNDVGLAIAPEIGEGASRFDRQAIGLGRLGRTEFEIGITGHACHGADAFLDQSAVNAVHEASKLGALLAEYCPQTKKVFETHGIKAVNAAYVSLIEGGKGILSVPDTAKLILDRVVIPGESADGEIAALQDLIARGISAGTLDSKASFSVQLRGRPTPPCAPYFFDPEMPAVQAILAEAKRMDLQTYFTVGRSVADENRIAARGIPTLTIGPEGAGSHTSWEWVDVASVERLEQLFTQLSLAADLGI